MYKRQDEGYMEYELMIERLRQSVENLPGQTKVVFRMCFLDGKKYQEAADELMISINTVKTHINKACLLYTSVRMMFMPCVMSCVPWWELWE